jgi:hypothetical protein
MDEVVRVTRIALQRVTPVVSSEVGCTNSRHSCPVSKGCFALVEAGKNMYRTFDSITAPSRRSQASPLTNRMSDTENIHCM